MNSPITKIDAERAGVSAYNNGIGMAPALNPDFIRAACRSGHTLEMLNDYVHGWTIAMLADRAPVGSMPSVAELERICTA